MDGTLLSSAKEVSERNKRVLRAATDKGVQVVISTGRIFTSARYYAKLLGLITPIISCNGAYVCEYHRKNVLYENSMELIDFKEVVSVLEDNDMYYHFYDNNNFYTKELKYSSLNYYNWNQRQKPGDRVNIEIVDNPIRLVEERNSKIYKIVVIDSDKNKLENIRKLLSKNSNIEIVSSWNDNIEIMNKGVTKGRALEKLCELFNVSRDEVIAIGDNYNDISMLEFAGTAVAMGNGEEQVKKIADLVTDTNDNDGVAKAIEKLLF
jgi:hypothetical protein